MRNLWLDMNATAPHTDSHIIHSHVICIQNDGIPYA